MTKPFFTPLAEEFEPVDDVVVHLPDEIPFHPLANLMPMIEGAAETEFRARIEANGQRRPIVLHQGMIVDGRNRYRACRALGIAPKFTVFGWPDNYNVPAFVIEACLAKRALIPAELGLLPIGLGTVDPEFPVKGLPGDVLAFVLDENVEGRRHLNESQRAMIAAAVANLTGGRRSKDNPSIEGVSADEAARRLNVGRASIERARVVARAGVEELQGKVRAGAVSVSAAEKLARLAPEEQREVVARGEAEIVRMAKEIGQRRRAGSRTIKLARIAEIAKGNKPLPEGKQYPVIYADFPWDWETWSEKGMDRAPAYPTATLDQLLALNTGKIATKDAVFFCWATVPKLPQALKLLADAGFKYVSQCVWDKEWIGTGYWFRVQHEILLVGTRGDIPAPLPGTQIPSVYREKRTTEHSRKPEFFLDMIDRLYPGVPKIELFQREGAPVRPGWEVWGNQAATNAEAPADGN